MRNITPTKSEPIPENAMNNGSKLKQNNQEIKDAGKLHLSTPNSKTNVVIEKSDRKREANSPISDQPNIQKARVDSASNKTKSGPK